MFGERVARLWAPDRAMLQRIVAGYDVPAEESEALRVALDCTSVAAMRDAVVRTSALHDASPARVHA